MVQPRDADMGNVIDLGHARARLRRRPVKVDPMLALYWPICLTFCLTFWTIAAYEAIYG